MRYGLRPFRLLPLLALMALSTILWLAPQPAQALLQRDSLGVFGSWGAFYDTRGARCYAIAEPEDSISPKNIRSFISIGYWPKQGVRGQFYARLSRKAAKGEAVTLSLAGRSFRLSASASQAWARDKRMDAAIIAAMRNGGVLRVRSRDAGGKMISDRYQLDGAATAMDAAALACSRKSR